MKPKNYVAIVLILYTIIILLLIVDTIDRFTLRNLISTILAVSFISYWTWSVLKIKIHGIKENKKTEKGN